MPRGFGRCLKLSAFGLVGFLWMSPTVGTAQTQERWSKLLGPDGEALPPTLDGRSSFTLFGSADYGIYRMNMPGRWCWENQHGETDWICPLATREASGTTRRLGFRNTSWNYGVPPSQWEKAKALVPALENATGGGWSVFSGYTEEFLTDQRPADGSLGPISAGATSRADGSCADIGFIGAGDPLLPTNICPETWGSLGYTGAQIVPVEAYDSAFQADAANFSFDFWRLPEAYAAGELIAPRALGFHQVYGSLSDWTEEKRAQYGSVLPGGSGDPTRQGWPLGIEIREDAFAVPIPPLASVLFVQALIINRSQDLYGVPIDYDSLYIGLSSSTWWESGIQNASFYFEPWSGMMKSVSVGVVQSPPCNGANPATDILCYSDRGDTPGFEGPQGGGGYVILKSPIGDLRNKLFTRRPDGTPCDPDVDLFCDPDHPLAGDTITYNIAAPCGFRSCTQTTWRAVAEPDWQRRMFGLISGITRHAVGARTATTISDRDWWHLTRSYTHPNRVDDPNDQLRRDQGFNTHIPGVDPETRQAIPGPGGLAATWDWNHDGNPDTLFYSSCNPFGCSETWSDTLRGPPGAGPYVNSYGNVGTVVGVGPISLAAGDTASWVMAYYIGDTQEEVDRFAANAVDHYLAFYLAPAPPRVTSIRTVDVQPGNPTERRVTLYLGDESETWVDAFLAKQAEDLVTDPISAANPWLPDTIAFLAENNLQAVHVFRSCDGGVTFDSDGDCDGDPATGGVFADVGWLPYQTFDLDALGEIPNVFEDVNLPTGSELLYSIVAETRGAEPLVINPNTGRAEVLGIAPRLLNALSTSRGDPNVVSVYVPASLQAGARRASVDVVSQAGPAPIAPDGFHDLSLVAAGDDVDEGTYTVRFGATAEAVDSLFGADPLAPDRVASFLVLENDITGVADTLTATRLAGITTAGGSTSEAPFADGVVRTTTFDGLTAALIVGSEPLLATDRLSGEVATPGEFITRADWPRLLLSVADQPGDFNDQFFLQPTGDTVPAQARPGVIWGVASAVSGGGDIFGDVTFAWEGNAYGGGAPFTLSFLTPEVTEGAVAASLQGRPAPQRTLAPSAEALALAQTALGVLGQGDRAAALTESDLVQADLPFAIRNASFNRAVDAIMLRRPSDTRLFGRDADTLRLAVPSDIWLPGDTLILVETVGTEQQVTWARSVLGCFEIAQFVRLTCNPVAGRGGSLYLSPRAGQTHHVQYFNAFTAESEYTFTAADAAAGDQVTAEDIRNALDQVRVVPNPYILSARTDLGNQSNILFTNLPPRGRLRVYTVSGQFVQEITWEPEDLADPVLGAQTGAQGDLRFDLATREGNQMASGLYIFHVTALGDDNGEIGEKLGKFVIIR